MLIPVASIWYAVQLVDDVKIHDNVMELGLDPIKLGMMNDRIASELKAISHSFTPAEEGTNKPALSVIIDENVINSFIAAFTTVE